MNAAYQLANLKYAYGDEIALDVDNYVIEQGSMTALLGPNGSGKSTLLNLLAFLNKSDAGDIQFFGQSVKEKDYPALRRRIAYVQQKPYLFNTSVQDNIELGLKLRGIERQARRKQAAEVVAQCQIGHLLHRRAHELSGGEVQKVALARAMILLPEVLLLDEPFSHLDEQFKQELEQLLRDVQGLGSQTIVFSIHDRVQAQELTQHICTLDHGRIVPGAELNIFRGKIDKNRSVFDTGRVKIQIPADFTTGQRLAIESNQLVVSREKLSSSMRNSYSGRVKSLREEGKEIRLIIEAGEEFHALITHAALQELGINIGETVWVSFKSTAVRLY